jgi:hypothetical protein
VRRLREALAWLRSDKAQRTLQLLAVAAGLGALKQILQDHETRLENVEERGLAPLDDLVTLRDLEKIEGRIAELAAASSSSSSSSSSEAPGPLEGDGEPGPLE